jgi:hypothetical protein
VPTLLAWVFFTGLNGLWNHPDLGNRVGAWVPYTVAVYLFGGSGVALLLLWGSARAGRLGRDDLGLGPRAWAPPRRLVGLALVVAVAYGGFRLSFDSVPRAPAAAGEPGTTAGAPPALPEPTWGEYCFWFVALLSASQAEFLVFVAVGFCLTESWLRHKGVGRWRARLVAAVAPCVAFGLYHYTYEPRWHAYAVPLMAEMVLVVAFFVGTRNLYLAVALHDALAATGFITEAHSGPDPVPLAYFADPWPLALNLTAFLAPFLLLHLLEGKGWLEPWVGPAVP